MSTHGRVVGLNSAPFAHLKTGTLPNSSSHPFSAPGGSFLPVATHLSVSPTTYQTRTVAATTTVTASVTSPRGRRHQGKTGGGTQTGAPAGAGGIGITVGSRRSSLASTKAGQTRRYRAAPGGATKPKQINISLEKVLLLDVDGVLHPGDVRYENQQFRVANMNYLRELLAAVGGMPDRNKPWDKTPDGRDESSKRTPVTIVLSSAWRLSFQAKAHLKKVFKTFGLPMWVHQTPNINQYSRAKEILTWVRKFRPKTWVAIDDWPLLEESADARNSLPGHFVNTNPRYGLTQRDLSLGVALFAAQLSHQLGQGFPSEAQ